MSDQAPAGATVQPAGALFIAPTRGGQQNNGIDY
uniref:Uncharacterized protein n=1 Tax=Siphoviridae sp. ct0hG5 TaxID=2826269 RepID=A0A8S5QL94_9CAUD|nr:MAG TPA: hypothetical protein [Siphoviridae sp. ct0hG5]